MEKPELIEETEDNLSVVIEVAHRSGLNYWQILKIISCKIQPELLMKADQEYWLNMR